MKWKMIEKAESSVRGMEIYFSVPVFLCLIVCALSQGWKIHTVFFGFYRFQYLEHNFLFTFIFEKIKKKSLYVFHKGVVVEQYFTIREHLAFYLVCWSGFFFVLGKFIKIAVWKQRKSLFYKLFVDFFLLSGFLGKLIFMDFRWLWEIRLIKQFKSV